jgi:hypothetical protein
MIELMPILVPSEPEAHRIGNPPDLCRMTCGEDPAAIILDSEMLG